MLLKLVWIFIMFGGKYPKENAKNGISERLGFEIFLGSMPPDPLKSSCFQRFRNCLGYQKSLPTALTCDHECIKIIHVLGNENNLLFDTRGRYLASDANDNLICRTSAGLDLYYKRKGVT